MEQKVKENEKTHWPKFILGAIIHASIEYIFRLDFSITTSTFDSLWEEEKNIKGKYIDSSNDQHFHFNQDSQET